MKSINMWVNERSSVIELISFRSLKQKRAIVPGIHHPTNVFLAKWCNSYTFGDHMFDCSERHRKKWYRLASYKRMEKGYNRNCRKHWGQFVFSIKSEIRWQRHRWVWYKVVDYHLKCIGQKRDKMLPDPRRREMFRSEWLICRKETNPYRSRKFSNLRKEQNLNWIALVGLKH